MLMIENQTLGLREFYAGQAAHAYNELDFQLSERLFKQALAQSERTGVTGQELAGDVSNVARACHQQAKFAEAEQYYRRALSLLEPAVGNRHPDLADVLHDLARIKCTLGEFAEGRDLLKRALAIRSQLFGPSDPQVRTTEDELASIPVAGEDEPAVAKHLPVAKEIEVPNEPFPQIDSPPASQPSAAEPPTITNELSLLLDLDLPVSEDAWLVASPPADPPPVKTAPQKPMDKGTITVEMNATDLHSTHEPLVETVPGIVEELCASIQPPPPIQAPIQAAIQAPIQTATPAVFEPEEYPITPSVPPAVNLGEQPKEKVLPIAIDTVPAPFFDIAASSANRQKPIDFTQFKAKEKPITDSGPRRRLPRSLVGEAMDFACEPSIDVAYDYKPRLQSAPKGVPLSFSSTSTEEPRSRFWQYIGIGVAFQIIMLILIAVFCRGG